MADQWIHADRPVEMMRDSGEDDAAYAAGWSLQELDEGLIDDAWLRKKPKWERYAGWPISFVMVWRLGEGGGSFDHCHA